MIRLKHRVIIAADKGPLALLKKEFPDLPTIVFPGYNIHYPTNGNSMILKILLRIPNILQEIKKEHAILDKIIPQYQIDIVISDNRYGAWSNKIPSIFITHQLFIKAPFGEYFLAKITQKYIHKFSSCWIPDYEQKPYLSGALSHKITPNKSHYKFIGPLSRFSNHLLLKEKGSDLKKYDVMVIISGPEPQRSIFEKKILDQLQKTPLKMIIVRGLPDDKTKSKNSSLKIVNHLKTDDFLTTMQKSDLIIARSGYSTIMDLILLGKKAILIPTPGQTEQEYLAEYHSKEGNFYTQKQKELNLEKAFIEVQKFSPKNYPLSSLILPSI